MKKEAVCVAPTPSTLSTDVGLRSTGSMCGSTCTVAHVAVHVHVAVHGHVAVHAHVAVQAAEGRVHVMRACMRLKLIPSVAAAPTTAK